VLLGELRAIRRTDFKVVIVRFNRKFKNLDHVGHRFFEHFCNRLIFEDWPHEIRVDDSAKTKQDDVTEQLRVISRWMSDETMFARLMH